MKCDQGNPVIIAIEWTPLVIDGEHEVLLNLTRSEVHGVFVGICIQAPKRG